MFNSKYKYEYPFYLDEVFEIPDFMSIQNDLGSPVKAVAPEMPVQVGSTNMSLIDGTLKVGAIFLPVGQLITGVKIPMRVAGNYTADNYNGVGLYSYNAGVLTLVASTANDAAMWTGAANTVKTQPFAVPLILQRGTYFYALLYNQSAQVTQPNIYAQPISNGFGLQIWDYTNSAKTSAILAGQAALPSPVNMAALNNDTANPIVALY